MSAPVYTHLISKTLDPFFAISIGVASAAVRIRREEREKGREPAETLQVLKRRVGLLFETGDEQPVKPTASRPT